MRYPRMIISLLENDLYKWSMGQAIYRMFSKYRTRWSFRCRNTDVCFTHEMIEEIRAQLKEYCNLRFSEDELDYLAGIRWIEPDYIDFLRIWRPRFEDFLIEETTDGCHLKIQTFGTWLNTSMYEIPILAIVNEVYYRMKYDYMELLTEFMYRADRKRSRIETAHYRLGTFSEFGLRRRLSSDAQDYIVRSLRTMVKPNDTTFIGTSNVYLARKYGLTPVGTMAHEFIQCVGQGNHKHNPAYSNYYMMKAWEQQYGVDNGIALTDCLNTDVFLRDFSKRFATLFSGVRHDSGDPVVWGNKILAHWQKLGIDPHTKTLLFSDSLNFEKADALYKQFHEFTNVAFGIGTYLTNDTSVEPLNIVCKVIECNGNPVAKLSDNPSKGICEDKAYIEYLKRSIDWRLNNTND